MTDAERTDAHRKLRGHDFHAHRAKCGMRVAALGAVAVECPHGFDCCPECDPCTCDLSERLAARR